MSKIELYFPKDEYTELAGPDWPAYEQFIQNNWDGVDPHIKDEINGFLKRFIDSGIKFPIKTKTACQSKWTWSTIYLNTLSTASCHRVKPVPF